VASIRRLLQRFNGDPCRAKPEFLHIERLIFEFQLLTRTCKIMEELTRKLLLQTFQIRPLPFFVAHVDTFYFGPQSLSNADCSVSSKEDHPQSRALWRVRQRMPIGCDRHSPDGAADSDSRRGLSFAREDQPSAGDTA
jgi:hypothetical protein